LSIFHININGVCHYLPVYQGFSR